MDLAIIGGPAGYVCAIKAAQYIEGCSY